MSKLSEQEAELKDVDTGDNSASTSVVGKTKALASSAVGVVKNADLKKLQGELKEKAGSVVNEQKLKQAKDKAISRTASVKANLRPATTKPKGSQQPSSQTKGNKAPKKAKTEIGRAKENLDIALNTASKAANGRLIKAVYIAAAFMCISFAANVYFLVRDPLPPQVLTTDKYGAVTPIASFTKPPSSINTLINLSQSYAMELFDMNAVNAEERIASNREFFVTERHFEVYRDNLIQSDWFKAMKANQMNMRAIPVDIPMINGSGSYSEVLGMLEWRVSVPVRIRIEGPGVNPQNLERVILFQLVHANTPTYHHGIAIAGLQIRRKAN